MTGAPSCYDNTENGMINILSWPVWILFFSYFIFNWFQQLGKVLEIL